MVYPIKFLTFSFFLLISLKDKAQYQWNFEACKKHCEPLLYHPHPLELEAKLRRNNALELHAVKHSDKIDLELTILWKEKLLHHPTNAPFYNPEHQLLNICTKVHL